MMGQTLRRMGLAVLLGAAFALPFPAIAQERDRQDKDRQDTKEKSVDKRAEKAKWKLAVFELKHRNPQELTQVLNLRVGTMPIAPPMVPTAGFNPAYPVRQGVPGGFVSVAQPQAAVTTSGYRGAEGQMFLAFDPEAKLLFVRGPEDQVRKVEELVKALDVPNDKLQKAEFGDLHLIPVRQDKLPQVARTLSMLRINNQVLTIGDAAMIAVRADGEDDGVAEEVREVISKYDAASGGKEARTAKEGATDRNK